VEILSALSAPTGEATAATIAHARKGHWRQNRSRSPPIIKPTAKGDAMNDHQNDVQALTGPTIEEAIARMANAGISAYEIGQALILTGAGLLTPPHLGRGARAMRYATFPQP
jgi:hypothetical protein